MARPINELTLAGATSTQDGEEYGSKGHDNITLFVVASNLDTANDSLTVELQHSARGEHWESLGSLSESDFTDGVASIQVSDVATEYLRGSVTSFDDAANDDLSVDAYVLATGWIGGAYQGSGIR